MTKTKFFAAAAVMASMIATPVLAKDMSEGVLKPAQLSKTQMRTAKMSRQGNVRGDGNRTIAARADRGYDERGYRADTGFFPVDVAAGIVGGAVGTADAIVTTPFGGPDVAYNDGYRTNNGWDRSGYNDGYNRTTFNDGYNRTGYRGSYALINDYPRVGAFATAPYTNPVELNRVGNAVPFLGQSYAERNGFVCVPGTVFTNLNGIRTLCQ